MPTGYEHLLLANLKLLERLVTFACRRRGVTGSDAEDVASYVKLRLIENDYAILRRFEGKSSLATYLTVVVRRLLCDYYNKEHGKWRPSSAALRLGPAAVELEALVYRDGRSADEALEQILLRYRDANHNALNELISRPRCQRQPSVASALTPDDELERRRRERLGESTSNIITTTMRSWRPEDQLLVCMRFGNELTVAEIARVLRIDQKTLYKRMHRLLEQLRTALLSSGLSVEDLKFLLKDGPAAVDLRLENIAGDSRPIVPEREPEPRRLT